MPIYEYRCSLCGQEHEVLQKVTEPQLTDCPSCGKPGLQKQLTAPGFQLKGSGWYATDFKGGTQKSQPKAAEDQKAADTKTDTKTDPKTDTKTDTKTEPKKTETKSATACTD